MYKKAIEVRKQRLRDLPVVGTTSEMLNRALIQEQIDMFEVAQIQYGVYLSSLVIYLTALRGMGFHRLHVSDVIPASTKTDNGLSWSQFPKLDALMLADYQIKYDPLSGWFTL